MEEIPQSTSPRIVHSLKQDTIESAQEIVGSTSVPADEALLLAGMHAVSKRKRRTGILAILGVIFMVLGLLVFFLPEQFLKQEEIIAEQSPVIQLLKTDAVYTLQMPSSAEVSILREKSFSGALGISEIKIVANETKVPFVELLTFLPERFMKYIESATITDYLYGMYTDASNQSVPFLLLETKNRDILETNLLVAERTMYTDFANLFHLPINSGNEARRFEPYASVRNPLRQLRDQNEKVLLLYGFPVDNIALFTTSFESYNAVRSRLLTIY